MYTKKDIAKKYDKAIKALETDDNVLFMDDVIAEVGVSKAKFYECFPKGSKEYEELWEKITENRIKVKKYIRLKLRVSGKAAELLSLYRMICTEEERRAINQNYLDIKGNVDNHIQIGFVESNVKPANSEEEVKV